MNPQRLPSDHDVALTHDVTPGHHISLGRKETDHMSTSVSACVLVVRGELDQDSALHLWSSTVFAFDPTAPITIDMSGVTFMDSSAVGALISAAGERQITIVNPSQPVRRVLSIVGLTDRFGVS